MSTAAIAHYAGNMPASDPRLMQQLRDATAQARQQLRLAQRDQRPPAEQTLEGELLNKQGRQQQYQALSEEEYLARHQEQRAHSSEGYQSPIQRAVAAYQVAAQLTQPAAVDRRGILDVYA